MGFRTEVWPLWACAVKCYCPFHQQLLTIFSNLTWAIHVNNVRGYHPNLISLHLQGNQLLMFLCQRQSVLYSRQLHSCLPFCALYAFRLLRKIHCAVELLLLCSVEKQVNESKLLWGEQEVFEVQVRTAASLSMYSCIFEILVGWLVFLLGLLRGVCFSFKLAEKQYKIIGW